MGGWDPDGQRMELLQENDDTHKEGIDQTDAWCPVPPSRNWKDLSAVGRRYRASWMSPLCSNRIFESIDMRALLDRYLHEVDTLASH